VELKRPTVKIGSDEVQQLVKYANTVVQSAQFDQSRTQWDLFLVSSEIKPDVQLQRNQVGRPLGCILQTVGLRCWVFSWGEIIHKAKEEMRLVREHLQLKSLELSSSDYLKREFAAVLAKAPLRY
jgi:hypothetical protein